MADKKAPEETEEKTQAKEHDVSIVLSYMDDEHEKAAIEVSEMPPPPQPRRRRFWFFVFDFDLDFDSTSSPPPPASPLTCHPPPPRHVASRRVPTLTSPPQVACAAFDKFTQYKDVAQCIKKEYDARYPSTGKATDGVYHAVVGKHFGASFSHETNSYVHLKVDLNNVVVFKSKDSPFDIDQP